MVVEKKLKKKKKWFPILAPKEFGETKAGETFLEEPGVLKGRKFPLSLMNLTENVKKQNMEVILEISEIKDNKVYTTLEGYRILPTHVRRMTRKVQAKFVESSVFKTKDGLNARIQFYILIRNEAPRSALTALRKKALEVISEFVKDKNYGEIIMEIIEGSLQKKVREETKKILPIAACIFNEVCKE